MNIILLEPADWLDNDRVALTGRRFQHINNVLAIKCGDTVRVGLINGKLGNGVIECIDNNTVTLSVTLSKNPVPRHPYHIILALPRPKMLRRVLRTAAEFGVEALHLIHSYRVEKSYWQSPLLNQDNIENSLRAGLERSGDTQLPIVQLHRRFRPFVEDVLPNLLTDRKGFIAHPGEYPKLVTGSGAASTVMIGPEGGFIPFELTLAMDNGLQPCTLGRRILSVDTAITTVLAQELH
tara:strand:+ start:894 stop:1604 length:711 start_codon:yes stop_codon:yes gene_type:complete